ncbi:hypothetical protein [Pontibacter qinzhouensis]|uniref:hypothetical protein n=1 Tax=Pontibacter qinzhouensis TaxID=2603253 RepID=UPI00164FE0D6|nr:hypothetical protein [Pontibacter qinzhouensis]
MIGSYRKYFKESREAVMAMSWANFIADLAAIPTYDSDDKEKDSGSTGGSIDANDLWK